MKPKQNGENKVDENGRKNLDIPLVFWYNSINGLKREDVLLNKNKAVTL